MKQENLRIDNDGYDEKDPLLDNSRRPGLLLYTQSIAHGLACSHFWGLLLSPASVKMDVLNRAETIGKVVAPAGTAEMTSLSFANQFVEYPSSIDCSMLGQYTTVVACGWA